MTFATPVTEIERAALQMLKDANIAYNDQLTEHINKLYDDPDFAEWLPNEVASAIDNQRLDKADFTRPIWLYHCTMHDAAMRLIVAIVSYRQEGRPTGDQYHDLGGIAVVQTSLAAAVNEFHKTVLNAVINKYRYADEDWD